MISLLLVKSDVLLKGLEFQHHGQISILRTFAQVTKLLGKAYRLSQKVLADEQILAQITSLNCLIGAFVKYLQVVFDEIL